MSDERSGGEHGGSILGIWGVGRVGFDFGHFLLHHRVDEELRVLDVRGCDLLVVGVVIVHDVHHFLVEHKFVHWPRRLTNHSLYYPLLYFALLILLVLGALSHLA